MEYWLIVDRLRQVIQIPGSTGDFFMDPET